MVTPAMAISWLPVWTAGMMPANSMVVRLISKPARSASALMISMSRPIISKGTKLGSVTTLTVGFWALAEAAMPRPSARAAASADCFSSGEAKVDRVMSFPVLEAILLGLAIFTLARMPDSVKSGDFTFVVHGAAPDLDHEGGAAAAGGGGVGVLDQEAGAGQALLEVHRGADQVLVGERVHHQGHLAERDDGIVLGDLLGEIEAVLEARAAAAGHVDAQLEVAVALLLNQRLEPLACAVGEQQGGGNKGFGTAHGELPEGKWEVRPVIIPNPQQKGQLLPGSRDQGISAGASRPAFSRKPNIRLRFCIAWPEAPLTRLSITASTTTVSPLPGRCTAIRHRFAPLTLRVSGWLPGGMTSTKGSSAKRCSKSAWRSPGSPVRRP